MGARGAEAFENDDAQGWAELLVAARDQAPLRAALEAVEDVGDGYLEAPEASVALAAAEVIAALHGWPGRSLPFEVLQWLDSLSPAQPDLAERAGLVVERILRDSELRELWDESASGTDWYAANQDLAQRLRA